MLFSAIFSLCKFYVVCNILAVLSRDVHFFAFEYEWLKQSSIINKCHQHLQTGKMWNWEKKMRLQ